MSSVSFTKITKRFDAFTAVDEINLQVQDGEFCVLVGPSGCGKTTALRMLAGLESPTFGAIHLGARDITNVSAKDRNIAMVFQNYALYPHMTVAENMGFALRMLGVPRSEVDERIRRAAALLEISTLLERRPRQLSGGQRQRVAVGRAIVRDPAAFLFDEPLSNLDAKLRNNARTELRDLQRRLGTTTVYVTHDQVEAMTMADRIVIMNNGRADQIGRPLEIYDNPETMFVAGFLGSPPMNLSPIQEFAPEMDSPLRGALLPFLERLEVPADTDVIVGVRPEHCSLEPLPSNAALSLSGRLAATEHLGAETILLLDRGSHRFAVRSAARTDLVNGANVEVYIPFEKIVFFEPAKGHRLRARR